MRGLLCLAKGHKNILEIGPGKATTTIEISKVFPDAKITAIEYDPKQIKAAKKNIKKFPEIKNIKILQGDACSLKLETESFEAVFAYLTFHHIKNWRKAVLECFRVLKKGGKLYVEDIVLKPFPRLQHFMLPTPSAFWKSEFIDELKKAGFKIIKSRGRYIFIVKAEK